MKHSLHFIIAIYINFTGAFKGGIAIQDQYSKNIMVGFCKIFQQPTTKIFNALPFLNDFRGPRYQDFNHTNTKIHTDTGMIPIPIPIYISISWVDLGRKICFGGNDFTYSIPRLKVVYLVWWAFSLVD